jgi:single-strand DNA-binding protein
MLKIQIIGNLGSDAIIKESNSSKFATFSVAVNEKYKDKNGNQVDKTTWVECLMNNVNHGAIPFIKKGNKIYVEGALKVSKYKREADGETQIQVSCSVSQIELLSSPTQSNNNSTEMPQ